MTKKLWQLMEEGAAKTKPAKGKFFHTATGEVCACAIGAAIYAVDPKFADPEQSDWFWANDILEPYIGFDIYKYDFDQRKPEPLLENSRFGVGVAHAIAHINDKHGRDAAIQWVKDKDL